MSEEDILNFNYPLQKKELIELEKEIKQHLRNISYNSKLPKEIDRFSDKYTEIISEEEILKGICIELLSPELTEMFGLKINKRLDVVEIDEKSSTENKEEKKEEEDEKESLGGGDDYSDYFNEEEDFVNEDKKSNKEDYML